MCVPILVEPTSTTNDNEIRYKSKNKEDCLKTKLMTIVPNPQGFHQTHVVTFRTKHFNVRYRESKVVDSY